MNQPVGSTAQQYQVFNIKPSLPIVSYLDNMMHTQIIGDDAPILIEGPHIHTALHLSHIVYHVPPLC